MRREDFRQVKMATGKQVYFYHSEQDVSDLARGNEMPIRPSYRDEIGPNEGKAPPDLIRQLTEGWADGAARVESFAKSLSVTAPAIKSRKRVTRWGADGDDLNIDRALRGDWDTAYRQTYREVRTGGATHVDLFGIWDANGTVDGNGFLWNGAAICAAADVLEQAGYSVRVVGCINGHLGFYDGMQVLHRNDVIAKDYDQPIRLDALASAVANARVFRTLGFRELARNPADNGTIGGAWGWEQTKDAQIAMGLWPDPEASVRLDQCYDETSAMAQVKRVLDFVSAQQN